MKKLLVFLPLLLAACDINVRTDDTQAKVIVEGESYSYIVVRLEFISQLIDLCNNLVLDSDFETIELADQARAKCVFDNLGLVNIPFNQFQQDFTGLCQNPPVQLTDEQLAQICGG